MLGQHCHVSFVNVDLKITNTSSQQLCSIRAIKIFFSHRETQQQDYKTLFCALKH